MRKDTQNKQPKSKQKSRRKHVKLPKHLAHINKMAAGIDIGSKSHFVAVPEGCDAVCVRRRLKNRLGAPKATTAAAHKLAVIIFEMIKNGIEYNETGQDYYEQQYRERLIKNLSLRAKMLGFQLVEAAC